MFSRIVFCLTLALTSLAQEPPARAHFQISGVLVDAVTGQPVSGAEVTIAPAANLESDMSIITGKSGEFLFSNLAPDKYALRAQRHGYITSAFDEHAGYATSIVVGPELESSNLVFRLYPAGSISGRISDEAGEPVSGAQVYLYQIGFEAGERRTTLSQQLTTDMEGFYHIGRLPPGKYLLTVIANVWYAQRPQPSQSSGSGVYKKWVDDSVPDPVQISSSETEEQGKSPLDVAYPIFFYPGTTEADAATPIVLKAGNRFVADLSLQPSPAMRIHIAGEGRGRKSAVPGGFVQLETRMPDGSSLQLPVETRFMSSGMEVVGVPPGRYQMRVSSVAGGTKVLRSGEVNVSDTGAVQIERETPLLEVAAAVQAEPGGDLPNPVYLSLYNPQTRAIMAGDDVGPGQVAFHNIAPGTYEASVNSNSGHFIKTLTAEGATVRGRTIEIKSAGPVKMNVSIGRGLGELKGIALRDGKPAGGVMVVLVPSDPVHNHDLFRRDQSDSDGTFALTALVPGKYTLLAIANGWELEWSNPGAIKSYLPGGEALQVQANGKYQVKVKVQ